MSRLCPNYLLFPTCYFLPAISYLLFPTTIGYFLVNVIFHSGEPVSSMLAP
jgi:hypothetical protein